MWEKIKSFFSKFWRWLWPILKVVIRQTVKELGEECIHYIRLKVNEVQEKNLSGKEKMNWVLNEVKKDYPDAAESAVRLFIENFVREIKLGDYIV